MVILTGNVLAAEIVTTTHSRSHAELAVALTNIAAIQINRNSKKPKRYNRMATLNQDDLQTNCFHIYYRIEVKQNANYKQNQNSDS